MCICLSVHIFIHTHNHFHIEKNNHDLTHIHAHIHARMDKWSTNKTRMQHTTLSPILFFNRYRLAPCVYTYIICVLRMCMHRATRRWAYLKIKPGYVNTNVCISGYTYSSYVHIPTCEHILPKLHTCQKHAWVLKINRNLYARGYAEMSQCDCNKGDTRTPEHARVNQWSR